MADIDRADVRRTERPSASSTGAGPGDARDYLDLSDVALLDLVRQGESSAFAALWVRHADHARRVAGRISSTVEPDDLLAEAYTRILAAVRSGTGPASAFLPYLYATMRNVSQNAGRRAEDPVPGAADGPDLTAPTDDDVLDRTIVREAFAALPPQWRTVLWLTEVQGMQPRDVAAATGTSPNAVAAQAHRAREALKAAWLAAHVGGAHPTDRCGWAIGLLARDRPVRPRVRRHLDEHLGACGHCTLVAAELATLRSRLRGLLVPLLALPAAATGAPAPLLWTGGPMTAGPVLDPSAGSGVGAGGGMAPAVSSAGSGLVSAAAAAVSAVAMSGLMSGVVVDVLAPQPASPLVVAEAPAAPATGAPSPPAERATPSAPPATASRPEAAAPPSDPVDETSDADGDAAVQGPAPGLPDALPGPADVPEVDVPEVDVPEVDVPEVDVPEVDVPGVSPKPAPPEPTAKPQAPDDTSALFGVVAFDPGGRVLPEVSGTAPAGAVVELLAGGVVVTTVTAGADGTWHAVLDLPRDTHVLAVRPAASPGDLVRLGEVTLEAPAPLDVRDESTEVGTAELPLRISGDR